MRNLSDKKRQKLLYGTCCVTELNALKQERQHLSKTSVSKSTRLSIGTDSGTLLLNVLGYLPVKL